MRFYSSECNLTTPPSKPGTRCTVGLEKKPRVAKNKVVQEFYGIGDLGYRPVVFNNSQNNEAQAVRCRVVKQTPVPVQAVVGGFVRWVKRHYREVFPKLSKLGLVKELPFSEYIRKSNAAPGVKKQLIRTHAELDEQKITSETPLNRAQVKKWTVRKSFVKVENLCYRSPAGVLNKAPRLIQGAQPEFICLVGPWIAALQEKVKRDWNANNFICFTSSVSNLKAAQQLTSVSGTVLEDDVSAWDASYGQYLCELEVWLCEQWGVPVATQQLMRANINTRGATPHGVTYVGGAMRKSGDPYTSLFNSVMNGLLHLYIYCQHYGVSVAGARLSLRMLVQGDDNAMTFRQVVNLPPFQNMMLQLGFKAEAIFRPCLGLVQFCSMRLTRCGEGWVFVPKAGRVISKLGFFVNPPDIDPLILVRGTALGLWEGCHQHPLMAAFLGRLLELTKGVEARPTRREEWQMLLKSWTVTEETLSDVFAQYHMTTEQISYVNVAFSKAHLGEHMESISVRYMMDIDCDGPNCVLPPAKVEVVID